MKKSTFMNGIPGSLTPEFADVLDFLDEAQTKTKRQIDLSRNPRKILQEDKDLLQKLAQ